MAGAACLFSFKFLSLVAPSPLQPCRLRGGLRGGSVVAEAPLQPRCPVAASPSARPARVGTLPYSPPAPQAPPTRGSGRTDLPGLRPPVWFPGRGRSPGGSLPPPSGPRSCRRPSPATASEGRRKSSFRRGACVCGGRGERGRLVLGAPLPHVLGFPEEPLCVTTPALPAATRSPLSQRASLVLPQSGLTARWESEGLGVRARGLGAMLLRV